MSDTPPPGLIPPRVDPVIEGRERELAPSPQGGALGKRIGAGMALMVTAALANRGLALIVQAVLGILLTKGDFGVYAIAMSAAAIAQIFRDGGLRFILLQRGVKEFDALSGPVFWMSLAFNAGVGAIMAATAPVVASIYGDPRLLVMLLLIASTVPFGTPQMMSDTRLRIDLRFGVLSTVGVVSSLLRYAVTVLSAWAGSGPLSMVYGLMAATVFEAVATYCAAPIQPWRRSPQVDRWRTLFQQGKWTIMQSLAVSMIYFGMYASIGLFVDTGVVGVYSFAFAILSQSGHLLAVQLGAVLTPSIARLQDDHARRRAAILRSLHAMVVLCVPLCLLMGMVYAPVERLIWRGRWEESTTSVWIMAVTYPLFMLHELPRAVMIAAGAFRRTALLMLTIGVGMTIAAGLSARAGGTAAWIAAGTGAYSVVAGVWMIVRGLRSEQIGARPIFASIAPVSITLTAAAAGVVWADQRFLAGVHPLTRCAIVGVAGAFVFTLLLRILFSAYLRDLLRVTPNRLAATARRLLLLPADSPDQQK